MGHRATSVLAYRPILAVLDAHQVDVGGFLIDLGLDPAAFGDDEARVPIEKADPMWNRAADILGDPYLGLHLAQHLKPDSFGLFSYLTTTCLTVGDSLNRVQEYFRLVGDGIRYELVGLDDASSRSKPVVELICHVESQHASSSHIADFSLAAVYCYSARSIENPLILGDISFQHAAPESSDPYEEIFGRIPRFGSAKNALQFDADLLKRPTIGGNEGLAKLLQNIATKKIEQLPDLDSLTSRAKAVIWRLLKNGEATFDRFSAEMGASSRTLQHQLKQAGTSFTTLLDELRSTFAMDLITQPNFSLVEIAYLLGFSDQSSFNRAFRRWTDQTPSEYRKSS